MLYLKNTKERKIKLYDLRYENLPGEDIIRMIIISKSAYKGRFNDMFYPESDILSENNLDKELKRVEKYLYSVYDTQIILGEDWYIVYSFKDSCMVIDGMAMYQKDSVDIRRNLELFKGLKLVLAESLDKNGRPKLIISTDVLEDTSYPWILQALYADKPLIKNINNVGFGLKSRWDFKNNYDSSHQSINRVNLSSNCFWMVDFKLTNYGVERLGLKKYKKLVK